MAEYIEREALLRYLNDIWLSAMPNDFMPGDDRQLAIMRCMGLNDAMDAIKSIPAADVRPVVRGKWKVSVHKTYYDVSCSVCGINSFFQVDEKDSVSYANYCPNCGADMREEQT